MKIIVLQILVITLIGLTGSLSYGQRKSPFFEDRVTFDTFPQESLDILNSELDAGETLKLTDYLDNPKLGKRLSCVDIGIPFGSCSQLDDENSQSSSSSTPFTYSGFFTVNQTYDINLFYWFFEAQNGNKDAPILIFFQGGPGASSLFSLFVETGPYRILSNLTMVPANVTWNSEFHMMYIDNPVGTGFSYTTSDDGYSNNEVEIAQNLYNLLTQFYQIYPEFSDNDLYLTGESYAGKYVPALAYYIYEQNQLKNTFINLVGVAIGDGLVDPATQVTQYANLCYYTGLCDLVQQDTMLMYQEKIIFNIQEQNWMEANNLFTDLINGPPDYFQNITGNPNYYDIRRSVEPSYGGNYVAFVNSSAIRQLIHVGNNYFQNNNNVYLHLQEDIPKSVIQYVPTLIENYKVLFYNGQFDFIVGVSLTETMIRTIQWSGIQPFILTNRIIWKIPSDNIDVAGYVRQYQNLTQIVVRDAGHIAPFDQPERCLDMITRFVNNLPYPTGSSSSSSSN
ncbi:peptidase S10 family protein [Tieghemostelium lacteum]|uniref:Carboxypeptidase n=1 Tax=Tieghemostelium lacteum TaxID=361077 RepID=A0A152A6X2_TIELA|nr:peptidase S10 family protein [Tieghemostelium lacteum]|eukprot:KYR01979.1 peptidase S10 family protein [Tieghemostelium lacteum]